MANIILEKLSRSSSVMGSKDDQLDERGKMESMIVYLQIANALTTRIDSFDVFSNITQQVRLDEFIVVMFIVGTTYAFMDHFIKQYTGKFDFNQTLNPMLRGVNYGILLQVMFWVFVFGTEAGHALHYLIASFPAAWGKCKKIEKKARSASAINDSQDSSKEKECYTSGSIILRCSQGHLSPFSNSSAFLYFREVVFGNDKVVITERTILAAIIWILSFFLAVVSAFTLMKLLKLWIYFNVCSLIVISAMCMMYNMKGYQLSAVDVIKFSGPSNVMNVLVQMPFTHGVGMIGVYDFGCMSVYTLTDNAVIVYTISWIILSIFRSVVIKTVFGALKKCLSYGDEHLESNRLKLFGMIPMVADIVHLNKMLSLYMFMNLTCGLIVNLTITIATVAKLIQGRFRKVKDIYIIGIICFMGFLSTQVMAVYIDEVTAVKRSATLASLFLGAYKLIIVFYLYGISRFSTDVEFWLGFKPTIYWKLGWLSTPIILITFVTKDLIANLSGGIGQKESMILSWLALTLFTVVMAQFKTMISYILKNNMAAAFRYSKKYGPPDIEMRKQRKHYDANARFRKCVHICTLLDDRLDCSHEQQTETVGLTDIFREDKRRSSTSVLEFDVLKQD